MNRREWIRIVSLASGALVLPKINAPGYLQDTTKTGENEIEEIHLINL